MPPAIGRPLNWMPRGGSSHCCARASTSARRAGGMTRTRRRCGPSAARALMRPCRPIKAARRWTPTRCSRTCSRHRRRRLPTSAIPRAATARHRGTEDPGTPMPRVTLVEGINLALARALEDDPDVIVLGEDVGINGGVFRATVGLQERFGALRVQDTPLAEGLIAGMSVGMAAQGLRPVAEIQFMGFIYPALDQIANHMARLRTRTRGRLTCPAVIRMPHGGGIHAPEHHSESLEVLLCHHAGLRVVCPTSPPRAYGLLLAAIRRSQAHTSELQS